MQSGANCVIIRGMRRIVPALLALLLLSACGDKDKLDFQSADNGLPPPLIEIYEPVNGAVLPAHSDFVVDYAVVRGSGGAYVEIIVDQQKPMRVTSLRGRHLIHGLAPGRHTLLIVEHAADGKKTGGMARVNITVE